MIRVASEAHSSATKKNKEWQEKLPVVVLKAEEIMYSKANSEVLLLRSCFVLTRSLIARTSFVFPLPTLHSFIAQAEYMNPETLWDRANDAINTIIRRDESTETGELLPPCVEGTNSTFSFATE